MGVAGHARVLTIRDVLVVHVALGATDGDAAAGPGQARAGEGAAVVTLGAAHRRVDGAGKGKADVVADEAGGRERRGHVAALTGRREAAVIDRRRGGPHDVAAVAVDAGQRRPGEGAIAPLNVTLGAGQRRVATAEGELRPAVGVDKEQRREAVLVVARRALQAELLNPVIGAVIE